MRIRCSCALLTLVFITGMCYTPVEVPKKIPDMAGVIFKSGSGAMAYEPSTGGVGHVDWGTKTFSPRILCAGPGDTLILKSNDFLHVGPIMPESGISPLYKYVPLDTDATLIPSLSTKDHWCESLDYHPVRQEYLYCGVISDRRGMFILDRSFSEIRYITAPADRFYNPGRIQYAFLLNDNKILFKTLDRLLVLEGSEAKVLKGDVRVLARSHDRTKIVYSEEVNRSQIVTILDIASGQSTKLRTFGRCVTAAAFSPEGRYLVYTHMLQDLTNSTLLRIYDLISHEDIDAGLFGGGYLHWSSVHSLPPEKVRE